MQGITYNKNSDGLFIAQNNNQNDNQNSRSSSNRSSASHHSSDQEIMAEMDAQPTRRSQSRSNSQQSNASSNASSLPTPRQRLRLDQGKMYQLIDGEYVEVPAINVLRLGRTGNTPSNSQESNISSPTIARISPRARQQRNAQPQRRSSSQQSTPRGLTATGQVRHRQARMRAHARRGGRGSRILGRLGDLNVISHIPSEDIRGSVGN